VASSSKTICKAFRVVVCAAILTGSLFGRALHDLHHQLDHAFRAAVAQESSPGQRSVQETTCRCDSHTHVDLQDHSDGVRSERAGEPRPSEPDDQQHDAGSCGICYVLGLELDQAESVAVQLVALHLDEIFDLTDDAAVEQCLFSTSARGPPFEA
jgi:hypothetical protein